MLLVSSGSKHRPFDACKYQYIASCKSFQLPSLLRKLYRNRHKPWRKDKEDIFASSLVALAVGLEDEQKMGKDHS
jgi:hypothetical protein